MNRISNLLHNISKFQIRNSGFQSKSQATQSKPSSILFSANQPIKAPYLNKVITNNQLEIQKMRDTIEQSIEAKKDILPTIPSKVSLVLAIKDGGTLKEIEPLKKGQGGKHKDVYINKSLGCGYVVGKSSTSAKDAIREQEIEKYTKSLNNPELSKRVSTQKPITPDDIEKDPALSLMLAETGVDPSTVAKFELKNTHGVAYEGFHDYIKKVRENDKIDLKQKTKIARKLMSHFVLTLYYLGTNKISNADLHGKNLKISFKSDDDIFNPANIEHLEVFDWGKSSNGDGFKFNETLDFVLQEGDVLKQAQQKYMSSSELRSRRMVFADILSLATVSAGSGYTEFKMGGFAKQALKAHRDLDRINKEYSGCETSATKMRQYKRAYWKILKGLALFSRERIEQLGVQKVITDGDIANDRLLRKILLARGLSGKSNITRAELKNKRFSKIKTNGESITPRKTRKLSPVTVKSA